MEKKIAVYTCSGCGLDALDMEALCKVATGEYKVPICKNHAQLCGPEGVKLIKKDIADEGVNTIVIAACSPRVMYDVFNFEGCILDRVNLREQVVWCQDSEADDAEENTQMMAEDYLRMGITKVQKMELPVPYKPEAEKGEMSKDIMVVGGGFSGLTAALAAAQAGYNVVLVEKETELGGFQGKVQKKVTFPYKDLMDNDIGELVQAVQASDKIKVFSGAQIEKTSGAPCLFDVSIKQNGSSSKQRVGAIVMAAGWQPYDPEKLDAKLGYGQSPNVITNAMFEEIASGGQVTRPNDGRAVKNAVFIQCAGSRDPNYLPYCSSICCLASLKQACVIKEQDPEANVYVVYKELRTPGQAEDFYRHAQEKGVVFIRSQSTAVQANGSLMVEAEDEILGEKVIIDDLDMVVLATGMVPATALGPDFKPKPVGEEKPADKKKDELVIPPDDYRISNILNLQYRQGPEPPALKYDFPDSHYICFPYETRRTGVYAAGCVRRPMSTSTAEEDATGAAMKAIQCVELTSQGMAVHPRAMDTSFPEFFMQRCTQCKRCTEECPFGAINEDEKANPLPNPTRCRRCGVCMGACPERIISFKNYSVDMIGSMIKNIEVPDADDEKPRILVLACENDAYPALDMAGLKGMKYNPWVRVVPLRCLGSMNLIWVADSLSKGVDGILLLGCQHGDDYQCHFIRGSELSNIRLSKVKETLDRLVLESDRVRFETVSITDYDKLPALLDEFAETLEEAGPNPYKGF